MLADLKTFKSKCQKGFIFHLMDWALASSRSTSGEKIMRYSSAAQTRFYHKFHVMWVIKYRFKVLQDPMHERIREIIVQTSAEMGVYIVKGVLGRDNVYMFLSILPKLALANVMQRIKGRSLRRIQMLRKR